ncbi:MAG: hypothetical protein AAFR52_16045, partial [Pseudomonadota bacterium]
MTDAPTIAGAADGRSAPGHRALAAGAPPAAAAARPRWPGWAPALTLALMLGPIAAGLLGTLAPAFGWLP